MTTRLVRIAVAAVLLGGVLMAMLSTPTPLIWDAHQYADITRHVAAGDGYVTTAAGRTDIVAAHPPQYPPGLPTLLAPFELAGDVQVGARLLSVLYLLAMTWAAWALAGQVAALIAATAVVVSPFMVESSRTVLADAAGAAFALIALALLARPSPRRMLLVGAVSGIGVTVRLSHLPVLAAAVLAARGNRRAVALGAAPFLLLLGWWQWRTFGSPVRTGYGTEAAQWGWDYLRGRPAMSDLTLQYGQYLTPHVPHPGLPSYIYWPLSLGWWWVFAPPLFAYLGFVGLWLRRGTDAARFGLWTVVGMLALLLPYFWQGSRMIAPAGSMLVVFAAVGVVQVVRRVTDSRRDEAPHLLRPRDGRPSRWGAVRAGSVRSGG